MQDEITERIKDADKNREKEPLQLKYKAMAENPFRFFRGSCHLFYDDLLSAYPFRDSPAAWLCGDLHIENFGCYRGSNNLVYFDMNDFDEAVLSPVLWDISRLAVSISLAGTEIGFSKKEKTRLVSLFLDNYRSLLRRKKSIIVDREVTRGMIRKLVDKVSERKEHDLIRKRTDNKSKGARLLVTDRLLAISKRERKVLINAFNSWIEKKFSTEYLASDVGFRIAGTGSIGVKRYLFLIEHLKNTQRKLLIDVKQSITPSLSNHITVKQPVWPHEAGRIIAAQEMMQHVSPSFLSSFEHGDDSYVVKELQPTADRINLSQAIRQPSQVEMYLADLGTLTASAQLRSSGRLHSATADELEQFAADETWAGQIIEWSANYAEKVKQDYKKFYADWKEGAF